MPLDRREILKALSAVWVLPFVPRQVAVAEAVPSLPAPSPLQTPVWASYPFNSNGGAFLYEEGLKACLRGELNVLTTPMVALLLAAGYEQDRRHSFGQIEPYELKARNYRRVALGERRQTVVDDVALVEVPDPCFTAVEPGGTLSGCVVAASLPRCQQPTPFYYSPVPLTLTNGGDITICFPKEGALRFY